MGRLFAVIITRTPFRISFFGGGTDYPVWYRDNGGAVLSTTINKYCYVSCRYLPPFFDYKYLLRYSVREEVNGIRDIRHPSVRECLAFMNIEKGIEIVHTGDIPARSGIGSSSAFTIGLLSALYALLGKLVTKRQLARDAIHVEQSLIKENVGSQDQVATAFGGFNKIELGGASEFYVNPVTIHQDKLDLLQSHLMLFFTGFSRNASDIACEQIKHTSRHSSELRAMMQMVDEAILILDRSSDNLDDFGKLLHDSWMLKRNLNGLISNSKIDEIYEIGMKSGALGGKLLGAGGGGFILFFASPEFHQRIRLALKNLLFVPFAFEKLGTQIILYSTQDFY
jgi:D-glycero-alpha-D-manno-heptose-7-phosphate kinase